MKKKPQTNLKKIREQRGLSQFELSLKIGKAASVISNWECGERTPSLQNLRKLKRALGCTWDELLNLK